MQALAALDAGPLRALAGPEIAVALTDPKQTQPALWRGEAEAVTGAVASRRREFAAGRHAAREAMRVLGHAPYPVLQGPDRAPIWPDELVGSLSHTDHLCAAVMAHANHFKSLGLDIEDDIPLEPELLPLICTETEQAWLKTQPERTRGHLAKLIFSAKEAVYKCQYPLSHAVFGFDRISLTIDIEMERFSAEFLTDIPPFPAGFQMTGHYVVSGGVIYSLIHLPV